MSFKGKINRYVCLDEHSTVTIDVDEGVTPFKIMCRIGNCKQKAISMLYKVLQHWQPEYEWLKSGENQKDPLILRKIKAD